MPSPFPGMDPYLEGYLWPDAHSALAAKIRQLLTPLLRPRYTARLGVYVVEDSAPETELGIMYPDLEVLLTAPARTSAAGPSRPSSAEGVARGGAPAPLTIPVVPPIEVRLVNVEVRDAAGNELITCIELLSPVNKREPGLSAYRQKRHRFHHAGIHLIEVDLLRRGMRPVSHPRIPDVPYVVLLTRSHAAVTEVWPVSLREALPTIPVPLRSSDDDVLLDLQAALTAVYDEAAYDLSVDYRRPPPPPELSEPDAAWLGERLGRR